MMEPVDILRLLDLAAAGVFALTGALVASRKEMDLLGFLWLGVITGIGGGTLRDLLLGLPVFWALASETAVDIVGREARRELDRVASTTRNDDTVGAVTGLGFPAITRSASPNSQSMRAAMGWSCGRV